MTTATCADCGHPTDHIAEEKTLRRGSTVREPGEVLCGSCTSHRVLLVRSLAAIPNTLDLIRAKRMVRGAS